MTEKTKKAAREIPAQTWKGIASSGAHEINGREHFLLRAPVGATPEDLKVPAYWAKVGQFLSRHDVVFVLADDETWEAEVRVEGSSQLGGCNVTVVRVIDRKGINGETQELDDLHYVQHVGGAGFCVFRRADKVAIIQGHMSAEAARAQFMREQPKTVPAMGGA